MFWANSKPLSSLETVLYIILRTIFWSQKCKTLGAALLAASFHCNSQALRSSRAPHPSAGKKCACAETRSTWRRSATTRFQRVGGADLLGGAPLFTHGPHTRILSKIKRLHLAEISYDLEILEHTCTKL